MIKYWQSMQDYNRNVHKDDTDSAPDDINALKLLKDAQKATAVPSSFLDVLQLQIRYEKLTDQERTIL